MPAYSKILERECDHGDCPYKAKVEVFNTRNATLGVYCRRHGLELVSALNATDH